MTKILEFRFILHKANKYESTIELGDKWQVPEEFNLRLLMQLNEEVAKHIFEFISKLPDKEQNQLCQQ